MVFKTILLNLLHSEQPKLYRVLAVLSAIRLISDISHFGRFRRLASLHSLNLVLSQFQTYLIQSNFNGSNTFRIMKICSRQG